MDTFLRRWNLALLCLIALALLTQGAFGETPVTTYVDQVTLPPEDQASIDVVFSGFVQNEVSTYVRALAVSVNISTRRVSFVRHGDRAGYAFGFDQIVRVNILIRNFDDFAEASSTVARDAMSSIISAPSGVPRDLQRIGVVKAFVVPQDPRLYTYKVYSNFDLIYTFIYVVTAVLYASFVAFVIFKFVRQCLAEGEDKKNEEKERKRIAAKRELEAAERNAQGRGKIQQEPQEAFDRSDVDKEMLRGVGGAAGRVMRRLKLLEVEDEREQRALNLKPQISPAIQHFLDVTTLPPPDDPSMDPFYRPMVGGRPPLVPSSASPERTTTSINMDDL